TDGSRRRLSGVERFMSIVDAILASPITWGVAALILAAIALSGRFSVSAATVLLLIAWLAAVIGVYRSEVSLHLHWIPRYLIVLLCASAIGLGLYYLNEW